MQKDFNMIEIDHSAAKNIQNKEKDRVVKSKFGIKDALDL